MGEAENPGPRVSIVSANVTSFLHHLEYMCSLNGDIVAMQEVRLTTDAMGVANDLIVPYGRNAVWGKPQPIRRGTIHSTMDAKQGGVGYLLAKPHIGVPSPRTENGNNLYNSGRWQSLTVRINSSGLLVHIVTIYGFPRANEGGDPMEENEQFLSEVFAEAASLGNVPILVIGDFNIKPERSPVLANLVTAGCWFDIGQTFAILNGTVPQPTYEARGISSRIDLAFGNPELMRFLKNFEVLDVPHDGIRSHKPIRVTIDVSCPRAFALQTRKVMDFPECEYFLDVETKAELENDVCERYLDQFFQSIEKHDIDEMWSLWCQIAETFLAEKAAMESGRDKVAQENKYRGRGQAAEVTRTRLGNAGWQFEGIELNPEKRGLRKLLNVVDELINGINRGCIDLHHQEMLWSKSKRLGREHLKHRKVSVFWSFENAPDLLLLNEIRETVKKILEEVIAGTRDRTIRKWKKDRNERAKVNTGDLFRHFKPLDQVPLAVLKNSSGEITGDVQEMDQILRNSWLPIFAKHRVGLSPEPHVEAFMERFGHLIPHHEQKLEKIKAEELFSTVRKLKNSGAGGLDGWKPRDIKDLTPFILSLLLYIFDEVEESGLWPRSLCWASISLIPKGEGGNPLDLRPITVTPIVYRLWAAIRTKQCMGWQDLWIHRGQHGARARHSTGDALIRISLEFEEAILNGDNMKGIAVDLSKAFDNVPEKITFAVLDKMGIDKGLLRALRGMYHQIERRFKLGRYVGESFRSTNGILQGCPISVMLLNALMSVLHRAIGDDVVSESFVDDLTLLSEKSERLQKAMDVIQDFMCLTDQKVNEKKTKCFALKTPPEITYDGKVLANTNSVKILGVTWVFKEGYFELIVSDNKIEEMCTVAHRIRYSGISFEHRVLLCSSLIMSKILYGIEVTDFCTQRERALRTTIGYTVWAKSDKARNPGLLFTLPVKGHVCDPAQAPFVRRLNALHRFVKGDPSLIPRIARIWERKKKQRRMRRGGFVENLLYTMKRLGLSDTVFDENSCSVRLIEEVRDPLVTTKRIWTHESRETVRRHIWRGIEKEKTRGDGPPWGIRDGVDQEMTLKYYKKCDPKKKGILRKILLGGVWTRSRLAHLPDPPCSEECPCGLDREDLEHLWWQCPLWNDKR